MSGPDEISGQHQRDQGDTETENFAAQLSSCLLGGISDISASAAAVKTNRPLFRTGIFNQIWSGLVQFLFNLLGRRFLGKLFIATRSCTGCGQCAAHCPVGAIRMRPFRNRPTPARPSWGMNCTACNRCINFCPARSIEVSLALLVKQLGVNLVALTGIIIGVGYLVPAEILPAGPARTFVLILLATFLFLLVCLIQLGPLAWLLERLSRWTILEGFFGASYTRGFRRYLAPGFKPDCPAEPGKPN